MNKPAPRRTLVAVAAGIGLSLSAFAAPALAATPPSGVATPTISAVSTAYVKYPSAVPGRYCKRSHRGDWTKTAKYGKVKCVNKNGWRWKRI